jgi:uncharacterized membrane protein
MDADPAAHLHLDAVIAARPSLPLKGFAVLLAVVLLLNLPVALIFLRMGAPPIPAFMGLDVLALCLAFWISFRRARRAERVRISADRVEVFEEDGARSTSIWTSPTAFTRVALEDEGRSGPEVRLKLSGKRLTIGRRLGPVERANLAETVDDAIRAARAERWPA